MFTPRQRSNKLHPRIQPTFASVALVAAVLFSGCEESIHDAALKGDVETARRMLDANPQLINERNKLGKTPLHQSLTGGNDEIIKLLIERGADVNAQDNTGLTPLHIAAWWSVTARAKILIDHGANVNAIDKFGDTPLHTAAMNGRGKMCQFLITSGAVIDAMNKDSKTPLDLAKREGQQESIRVIEYYEKQKTAINEEEKFNLGYLCYAAPPDPL
ncbi:MAG: ankyrin repeat domain-containing protein [Candidatus Hydrogenedentes bacterium]|nr:ankyrin repeat domain-containing protein [Candidatus Hydrogenedentota bacterium]